MGCDIGASQAENRSSSGAMPRALCKRKATALSGMWGYITRMQYTAMLRQRPGNFVHLLCGSGARWCPLAEMASRVKATRQSAAIAAWPTMRMSREGLADQSSFAAHAAWLGPPRRAAINQNHFMVQSWRLLAMSRERDSRGRSHVGGQATELGLQSCKRRYGVCLSALVPRMRNSDSGIKRESRISPCDEGGQT